MTAHIEPNGRISGTRVTIYHVMDYYKIGWKADQIALIYRLNKPQIAAALEYIDANRAEVEREYQVILDRCERGNSPEVRALIEAGKPVVAARLAALRQKIAEKKNGQASRVAG